MGQYGSNFGVNWNHIPFIPSPVSVGRRGKVFGLPRQRQEVLQIQKVQVPFKMIGTPVRPLISKINITGSAISRQKIGFNIKGAALKEVKTRFNMRGAALKEVKSNLVFKGKKNYETVKAVLKAALLMMDEEE